MQNSNQKYLPIGTVVMLKGGKKRAMITGFLVKTEDNKIWDYSGVIYPEGFLSSDKTLVFNHEQIKEIYHLGLEDEEEEHFKIRLKEFINAK